jgi:antitoxin component of RelBE/YafQ-DinJ toxin-antitoxin module
MSKGTTRRSIRIDDGLWEEAQAAASKCGENLSDIIRQRLADYISERPTNEHQ